MPDQRQHRGPHPADAKLFAAAALPGLREAVADLAWLLGRGYPSTAALKLTGDRYGLTERQRRAVARAACSPGDQARRAAHCVALAKISGAALLIDGFNLLITVEAALSGGVILRGRDDCWRDMSGVHGSYRSVQETDAALALVGQALADWQPASVKWLLDKPVSNSGRLAQRIRELAAANDWAWEVELVFNPDAALKATEAIAVTTDAAILDCAAQWANFNGYWLAKYVPTAWTRDLGGA
jgi:hypothetical protein